MGMRALKGMLLLVDWGSVRERGKCKENWGKLRTLGMIGT